MSTKIRKVMCVFGTRPEAIKMAPLILGMKRAAKHFVPVVCVSGQHREMLRQVLDTFDITADHDLAVMRPNQTLAGVSARILEGVDAVIEKQRPDVVVVQGDTTTALAAALAAFYRRIPVAHVEAGLRTGDLENPFPEELNRVLVDRFSAVCFAPTRLNYRVLRSEGIEANRIVVTGNTGIDALLMIRERVEKKNADAWGQIWGSARYAINDAKRRVILITAHRRESFGVRVNGIFNAIRNLALQHGDWDLIYPLHLNPNVRKPAVKTFADLRNVHLIEPLAYEPFVFLMNRASLILTDSGGIQEEAPSLGRPVVVMRETTERVEALRAGTVVLAGNTGRGLDATVERMMTRPRKAVSKKRNPYGDGRATERILREIYRRFGNNGK